MQVGFIEQYVRKVNLHKIKYAVILLVIVIIALLAQRSYIIGMIHGFQEVTGHFEAVSMYEDPKRSNYVFLSADQLFDADYVMERVVKQSGQEVERTTTSMFMYATTKDGLLLIEIPYKEYMHPDFSYENVRYKGQLKVPTKEQEGLYEYCTSYLAEELGISEEEVTTHLLSNIYLDTNAMDLDVFVFVECALVVLLLLKIGYHIVNILNYRNDQIYRQLGMYGEREDIEKIINTEYANEELYVMDGLNYVFKTFIFCFDGKVHIRETKDLIWAFTYYFKIELLVICYVKLRFREGIKGCNMRLSKSTNGDRMLYLLSQNIPVVIGFDTNRKKMYEQDMGQFMRLYGEYVVAFEQQKEEKRNRCSEQ